MLEVGMEHRPVSWRGGNMNSSNLNLQEKHRNEQNQKTPTEKAAGTQATAHPSMQTLAETIKDFNEGAA
jgi:hypothetical protein